MLRLSNKEQSLIVLFWINTIYSKKISKTEIHEYWFSINN